MSIEDIRDSLESSAGFWDKLHLSLDAIGMTQRYVDMLAHASPHGRPKYVKDSVWGMMRFTPDELAIIDSPLLQRLRRIHQLGFTFLTYPSAEHSRFSHTLGVAHVVKRLIESIALAAKQNTTLKAGSEEYSHYDPASEGEYSIVRGLFHAALLHDCGHLAFSHAGEAAFTTGLSNGTVGGIEVEDFLQLFRDASFDSSLSECLSIAICLSPRFQFFYSKVIGPADVQKRVNEVCSFIGGVPHNRAYPGLANIISGAAVDADKIDYINRDAKECGIPVGVDVSRVFLNSALIKIDEKQARKLSRAGKPDDAARFVPGWHFIVNSTGVDTYDELANAKSILYTRVYLHQLTRNAEQLLAAAIRRASSSPGAPEKPDPTDVFSWFAYGDYELLSALRGTPESKTLSDRLTSRSLPKRAFVLFRDVCEPFVRLVDVFDRQQWSSSKADGNLEELDAAFARQTAWKLFDRIIPADPHEAPRRIQELREKIRSNAIAAREAFDRGFDASSLSEEEPYLGFAPRYQQKPVPEVLVREKNSIGFSSQWSKSDELTTADSIARGLDYFYSDPQWVNFVAVACTKVLYDFHAAGVGSALSDEGGGEGDLLYEEATFQILPRLRLRLDSICSRIGIDYDELVRAMNKIGRSDFFGHAVRIVPLDDKLQQQCQTIANRYNQLSGERGWCVTEPSVEAFVRQFPVALRDQVFALLAKGQMLDRGSMRSSLDTVTRDVHARFGKRLIICRFSPNSGNFVGMLLEQERRDQYIKQGHQFVRNCAELESALSKDKDACVVFVDDQFATGGQAHAQLLQWNGTARSKWPEEIRGEQNIDKSVLGAKSKALFRDGHVILAFGFGTDAGKERIVNAAKSIGFKGLDVAFAHKLTPEPLAMSGDLKEFLSRVGFDLLKRIRFPDGSTSPEQDKALQNDALGYGGQCSVMVTPFGAPSHTITAFWCPGIFEQQPWVPLFLRRGYRKHLVFG